MRSARQRLMINTNTTIDQDRRTEGNCVCVYTVHCRVIVDNKCGLLLRCSSHSDCNFDARLVITRGCTNKLTFLRFVKLTFVHRLKFNHTKKRTHVHTSQSVNLSKTRQFRQPILVQPIQYVNSVKNSFRSIHPQRRSDQLLVYEYSQVLRYVHIHQIRHHAVVGSSSNRQSAINQCSLGDSLHTVCLLSSSSVMVHSS